MHRTFICGLIMHRRAQQLRQEFCRWRASREGKAGIHLVLGFEALSTGAEKEGVVFRSFSLPMSLHTQNQRATKGVMQE